MIENGLSLDLAYNMPVGENALGANSSNDLISAWLNHTAANSQHTYDSYVKELRRFFIFCSSLGKHFLDANTNDFNVYFGILADPPPEWIIPPNASEFLLRTQVLQRALNRESVGYARGVLLNFYGYLNDAQVLSHNPVKLTAKLKKTISTDDSQVDKAISFEAWAYLKEWLEYRTTGKDPHIVNHSIAIRNRWLMNLLYYTGMRRSSVTGLSMSSFSRVYHKDKPIWQIQFMAKGSYWHKLIVPQPLLDELMFYRGCLGLDGLPKPDEPDMPLVLSLAQGGTIYTSRTAISSRGVNFVITDSITNAMAACEDPYIRDELSGVTPHTFRHTCATHQLLLGSTIPFTQHHLGHANANTTSKYLHNSRDDQIAMTTQLYGG